MLENKIPQEWNKGNNQYLIDNYKIDNFLSLFDRFIIIDAHLQLLLFDKAEELKDTYFSDKEESVTIKIAKDTLTLRKYLLLGNYEEAEKVNNIINDKCILSKDSSADLEKWIFFYNKVILAFINYLKNDFKKSLMILKTLEEKFAFENEFYIKFNTSIFNNLKATVEWKSEEITSALNEITKSITINKKFQNDLKLANDLLIRGHIYVDLGQFLKSLIDFENAKKIYKELNYVHGQKVIQMSIGEIKFIQGKLLEALALFKDSLIYFEGNDYQSCEIFLLIGKIYQKRKTYDEALFNYEKALGIANKIKFIYLKSLTIVNIVDLLIESKQDSKIEIYKNQFDQQSDNNTIKLMYLMVDGLIKQSEDKLMEAKKEWAFINSDITLPISLKIYGLEHELKLCIEMWKKIKELPLLNDIEEIIEKWEKLATNNFLMSSLATIYLLKAKFYIAILQIENAKKFLDEGLKISEKYGLEVDRDSIEKDKERILKLEQLELKKALELKETIELEELLDYLQNVQTNILLEKS